jgi:hypothetical protein
LPSLVLFLVGSSKKSLYTIIAYCNIYEIKVKIKIFFLRITGKVDLFYFIASDVYLPEGQQSIPQSCERSEPRITPLPRQHWFLKKI